MIFNFYYDQNVLIDAGPPSYKHKIENILKEKKVSLVVITHGHYDHYGGLKDLLKAYKLHAYVHVCDFSFVHKGTNAPVSKTSYLASFTAKLFMRGLSNLNNVLTIDTEYSLKKDYGINAKILHTPGHTLGSVSLVFNDRAYIGDLLRGSFFKQNKPSYPWAYQDLNEIKRSIKKLSELLPDDAVLYPGHGKPFRMKDAIALL